MDDATSPFHQNELSEEDLEVLRAFHAIEEPTSDNPLTREMILENSLPYQPFTDQTPAAESEDNMLAFFITEVDEDIAAMRLALQQLEQDDRLDSPGLKALKRTAHKVAGTAAAIGCDSMSTIARYIEAVIKMVEDGAVVYLAGLIALVHTVRALESSLQSIASHGYESKIPLLELQDEYRALNIDVQHAIQSSKYHSSSDSGSIPTDRASQHLADTDRTSLSVRVDLQHFNRLIQHTENLVELDTPLENAQKELETALYELQIAQARLRRLEPLLTSLSISLNTTTNTMISPAAHSPSSLVARILHEAAERTGYVHQTMSNALPQPLLIQEEALWDEMEIDRFTETNVLSHSLTEAIADVATATSRLRQAFAHLNSIMEQRVSQAGAVRNEAFLLRSSPFSILVTRLEQAIETMAGAQKERVQFEASGGTIEFDQEILERLVPPFQEVVQSSIAEGLLFTESPEREDEQRLRIWLKAHAIGNVVTIEMGFSLPVSPDAVVALREAVRHLYGSVSMQEYALHGLILRLCFLSSKRIIRGLLVRAGDQRVIVSYTQVQRVHYNGEEMGKANSQEPYSQDVPFADVPEIYHLGTLLGSDRDNSLQEKTIRTALILQLDSHQIAVEVDEVIGEVELVMKPLAPHLCRPGITDVAIDGSRNVLLVVNLPEMIRLKETYQRTGEPDNDAGSLSNHEMRPPKPQRQVRPKIVIADDSVYIRRSVTLTLSHESYDVLEAEDGIQTLELLSKEAPSLLLLDIEMPNLNGYDILNIIRTNRRFPGLKIVLLTSRSSEKHKQRAKELGAHACLTKPCPQDLLLKTIQSLLAEEGRFYPLCF